MPTSPLNDISKTLLAADRAKKQLRDASGKFTSKIEQTTKNMVQSKSSDYPPMVSLQVTNPVTYLKLWWKKVMSGEGIDVKFRVHPITAIVLALIICGAGFGLGRLTFPADSPIVRYVPKLGPTPTSSPWKEEAYTGIVQKTYSTGKYYLLTNGSIAISLNFPANVNPEKLIGKRILAVGKYNKLEDVLYVVDASDLELLPEDANPVPTISVVSTPVEVGPTEGLDSVTPSDFEPSL